MSVKSRVQAASVCILTTLILVGVAPKAHAAAYTLTVDPGGSSNGTITGNGINCPGDCTESIEEGTSVTITANPNSGLSFLFWSIGSGYCTNNPCTFVMPASSSVYLQPGFGYASFTVNVVKEGAGSGTVSGAGTYARNANATFTATPSAGSVFAGWQPSGDLCASYTSKAGEGSANNSSSCTTKVYGTTPTLTVVARFDVAPATTTSPTTTNKTTAGTTAKPSTPPTAATPTPTPTPSTPLLEVKVNNQAATTSPTDLPAIASGQPVVVSGKTLPNATVKLYIFSEPRTAEVKADSQGNWTYTIQGLESGDHRVEAEVVDPTTNTTLPKAVVARFSVAVNSANATKSPVASTAAVSKSKKPSLSLVIGAGALIVVIAGAAIYVLNRRTGILSKLLNRSSR